MKRRVVITGMGTINPAGHNKGEYWDTLLKADSCIDTIEAFDASEYASHIAGEVKDFDFTSVADKKDVKRSDRYILLALAAAKEAMEDSGIDLNSIDLNRFGTVISSGVGGIKTLETENKKLLEKGPRRLSPFLIPMMIGDMAAGRISIEYGLKGPNYGIVSACASASHAIGNTWALLKTGIIDAAMVGGSEAAVTPIGVGGFSAMKALSLRNNDPKKASRPFDKDRDGFVIGEGAGLLIIETLEHALKRGAKIYAEITGYAATGDAHHLSEPAPEGEGAQRAMKGAIESAGIQYSDIDYINAHGTSTPFNDKNESKAVERVFGSHAGNLNISSCKSVTGHLLGASGGIEAIATALALQKGIIPPTANYEVRDPECPLNYTPNKPVEKGITYALKNSFGFGGHNASLVFKKYND
ncbi:MAG: beta-ketoacyl-ACP synthase II [Chitinivibrionales bacterium]